MSRYTNDNNPHLKRLNDLEAARKLWAESEWILNFLRTITSKPAKPPNDEELLLWYRQNNSETR